MSDAVYQAAWEHWWEAEEDTLKAAFFEAWEETAEERPERFRQFVEAAWDRHVDSMRGQVDDNRD